MKILFIGGTGTISSAVSRTAIERGHELFLLNRGVRGVNVPACTSIVADITNPDSVSAALKGMSFDVVVDWVAFTPADVERDLALFSGRCEQYIFISSAAVYQKPPRNYIISEATPLENPFWDYAQQKIAGEMRALRAFAEQAFPVTIVRPSHTYQHNFPVPIGGGPSYTIPMRMKMGLPVVVHGDGTSLWTLTHAEDFARAFVELFGKRESLGQAFHITSDEVMTWNDIYQTIAAGLGTVARIVHVPSDFIASAVPRLAGTLLGDKSYCGVFDNSKIRTLVPGFRAQVPFTTGMQRALSWFHADPNRMTTDVALDQEIDLILRAYGHM